MEAHTYWHKQDPKKPLYPDIEWNKPEQKSRSGKLGIIGGNTLQFIAVAESYTTALEAGVGQVKVVLPDSLRKTIPSTITDTIFAKTNPSGGLAKEAEVELNALADWSNGILMVGDAGRNSETAILYERFIQSYEGQLTLTRDAIDLIKNANNLLVDRPDTTIVCSFAQLQKLLQSVYYPKILAFSMQLSQLVEVVHKFTITYPINIVTLHQDHIIVASGGEVATTSWSQPMAIWRGTIAAKAASYWLWNKKQALAAYSAAILT